MAAMGSAEAFSTRAESRRPAKGDLRPVPALVSSWLLPYELTAYLQGLTGRCHPVG